VAEAVYLLDSSTCITLLQGRDARLRQRIESCHPKEMALSTIVVAEVMIGSQRLDRVDEAEALVNAFAILPFDEAAARAYAKLPFKRGSFDRLIAAHAVSLGLTVVTANLRDFQHVPGLRVEDWSAA
jgi:tRNA(fMet)-specific endonuclease VapC